MSNFQFIESEDREVQNPYFNTFQFEFNNEFLLYNNYNNESVSF